MEINEKEHLEKTIDIVNKKIKENIAKLENTQGKLKQGISELSENFYETSKEGGLGNAFSNLSGIENLQNEFSKSLKRLSLQKNTPYFARIDFKEKNFIKRFWGTQSKISNKN